MQKGSLYLFGTNRNTRVKSTSLISGQDLCLDILLPYISINVYKSSTFLLICQYTKIRLGSLYHFRSIRINYVKSTSLISSYYLLIQGILKHFLLTGTHLICPFSHKTLHKCLEGIV
jgi:hypothetical protein